MTAIHRDLRGYAPLPVAFPFSKESHQRRTGVSGVAKEIRREVDSRILHDIAIRAMTMIGLASSSIRVHGWIASGWV